MLPQRDGHVRPGVEPFHDRDDLFFAEFRLPHDPSWAAESLTSECQRIGEAYERDRGTLVIEA